MSKKSFLPFLLVFLLKPAVQFGQAVTQAREAFTYFEKASLPLARESLSLCAALMSEPKAKQLKANFISLELSIEKKKKHLSNHKTGWSFQVLNTEYARFLNELGNVNLYSRQLADHWNDDSVSSYRKKLVTAYSGLLPAAVRLEQEISVFCIENHLNRPEDGSKMGKLFREGQQKLEYMLKIDELLIPVEKAERICLEMFTPDSSTGAEKRRLAFAALCNENNLAMKSLPACCGDRQVKASALNSLRLFSLEAKNELLHLEKFIAAEEEFILHHRQTREKAPETESEKEAYKKAVRKYNEDIKAANELIRLLERTREEHLRSYQNAKLSFIENWLTAFQE